MRGLALVLTVILLLTGVWLLSRPPAATPEPIDLGQLLGGAAEQGFERALKPRPFSFPEDHGPHLGFRNEWWYFTGNLETASGGRFGFQLVFFRNALAPGKATGDSRWRTQQAWMAHFAVTDVQADAFHAFERFNRGALDLAGARAKPFEVWLDDWRVTEAAGRWRLQAREQGVVLDLWLMSETDPLLQGEAGLSRKSAESGNASYYYSLPRLSAEGELKMGGQAHRVSGLAWLDREWSTSALSQDQAGWDWFSLQLGDGSDLMYYRLRRKDGSTDPFSAGSWRSALGRQVRLGPKDVQLESLDHWESPRGGRYPVRWRLTIPSLELALEVVPVIEQQELDLYVRYWEGAVDARGVRASQPIEGRGYLELTGYAE